MSYAILRRIVYSVGTVTLVIAAAGALIEFGPGSAIFGASLPQVARIATTAPFFVALLFTLTQGMPGGRAIVPIPGTEDQDAWLLILVIATTAPSTLLVGLAPAGAMLVSRDFLRVTMVAIYLSAFTRIIQLRMGKASGAVLPDHGMLH